MSSSLAAASFSRGAFAALAVAGACAGASGSLSRDAGLSEISIWKRLGEKRQRPGPPLLLAGPEELESFLSFRFLCQNG